MRRKTIILKATNDLNAMLTGLDKVGAEDLEASIAKVQADLNVQETNHQHLDEIVCAINQTLDRKTKEARAKAQQGRAKVSQKAGIASRRLGPHVPQGLVPLLGRTIAGDKASFPAVTVLNAKWVLSVFHCSGGMCEPLVKAVAPWPWNKYVEDAKQSMANHEGGGKASLIRLESPSLFLFVSCLCSLLRPARVLQVGTTGCVGRGEGGPEIITPPSGPTRCDPFAGRK